MKWKVEMHMKDSSVETFECPFEYGQVVWYAYPEHRLFRKDRWVVVRNRVSEVWTTNCFGIALENGTHILEEWFDRVFTDKDAAIDFCIKKNMQHKIKVYNW